MHAIASIGGTQMREAGSREPYPRRIVMIDRWEDAVLLKRSAEIDVLRQSTRFDEARQGGARLDGFIRQVQGRVRAPDAPRVPVDRRGNQSLSVSCTQLNQSEGHDLLSGSPFTDVPKVSGAPCNSPASRWPARNGNAIIWAS
jgi:hypothetical protein